MSRGTSDQTDAATAVLLGDQNVTGTAALNDLVTFKTANTATVVTQSEADRKQSQLILIALTIVAVIAGLGVAFWLSRGIIIGLKQVQYTLTLMTKQLCDQTRGGPGSDVAQRPDRRRAADDRRDRGLRHR